MYRINVLIVLAAIAIGGIAGGCANEVTSPGDTNTSYMEKVGRGNIWSDGTLYRTVGTPATFSPDHGKFDQLYVTGGNGTFADGVTSISESHPGDRDYNGGRWHVNELNADVDPEKYADATSVDDLDLSDFHSTDTYFECPLLR
jgi:hypothetical protein